MRKSVIPTHLLKNVLWLLVAASSNVFALAANAPADPEARARAVQAFRALPLLFEEGPPGEGACFVSRGPGFGLILAATETIMTLAPPGGTDAAVVRLELVGANPSPAMSGEAPVAGVTNHLVGKDRSKWRIGVRNFQRVKYREVYPGIDLVYYGNQSNLEFDFIVAPRADPNNIRLRATGEGQLRLDDNGDLVIETRHGEIRHRKPFSYQGEGAARREIASRFVLKDDVVSFELGEYDPAQRLVIDPVLAYSTLFGGNAQDGIQALAVDRVGNAHVAGLSLSTNLVLRNPLPGSPQIAVEDPVGSTQQELFVAKFNTLATGGASLVFSTYFGKSEPYSGRSVRLALDPAGNIYVGGETEANDLPTTATAYQRRFTGKVEYIGKSKIIWEDWFLAKLDPSGQNLLYCTYFGGSRGDTLLGLAVDDSGNAYLAGTTDSKDLPTRNAWMEAPQQPDAFLAKLNTNASGDASYVYGTYLPDLFPGELAADAVGNAYLTGSIWTRSLPIRNGFQVDLHGAEGPTEPGDSYLLRLDTTASGDASLVYSTYLGGDAGESAEGLAVDNSGNVHIGGFTNSDNFPTRNAAQSSYGGRANGAAVWGDLFLTRINTNLSGDSSLNYSTYLGGEGGEHGGEVQLDDDGRAWIVGLTGSAQLVARNSLQPPLPPSPNDRDWFIAQVDTGVTGNASLLRLSRIGLGGFTDSVHGFGGQFAIDRGGNLYVSGVANRSNFPTQGAFQAALADSGGMFGGDLFITKVAFDETKPVVTITAPSDAATVPPAAAVTGVAADDTALGPQVELTISHSSLYFDGTQWGSEMAKIPVPLNDAGGWSCPLPTGTNTRDGDYTVTVSVKDLAGNVSEAVAGITDRQFVVESGEPTVAITSVNNGATLNGLPTIAGTAADPSGVAEVRLFILRLSDNTFWDGAGWGTGGSAILPTLLNGDGSWQSTGLLPWLTPGRYDIIAIAFDAGGAQRRTDAIVTVPKQTASLESLTNIKPEALSWDGSVMYGQGLDARPARWSAFSGYIVMDDLPGGSIAGVAYATSADGAIAVGQSSSTDSAAATLPAPPRREATRWTGVNSPQGLGDLVRDPLVDDPAFHSGMRACSSDGSMAVGFGSFKLQDSSTVRNQAARWTAADGLQSLGELTPGGAFTTATGVSGDGSRIVGYGATRHPVTNAIGFEAFRWTQTGGYERLGYRPGDVISGANAISADGTTIVGWSTDEFGTQRAVRWLGTTIEALGELPGGIIQSVATAVSGDGKIIVGYSEGGEGQTAFIWDEMHGMRPLRQVLVSQFGLREFARWKLHTATAISADGTTICGIAHRIANYTEGYRAVIPPLTDEAAPAGPMLTPTATFKPKITISENYKESLQTVTDFDGLSYKQAVPKASWNLSMVASTAGIDLSQIDGNTQIGFSIGNFFHSALLSEDTSYKPGKTSAAFRLLDSDPNTGKETTVGTITCKWNAKTLTITATCSKADIFPILANDFVGTDDFIDETIDATVEFAGSVGRKEEVYARGQASTTPVNIGSVEEGVTIDLATVTIKGSGDYGGPVSAIKSPKNGLRTGGAAVDVSGEVADAAVLPNVWISVNGSEPEGVIVTPGIDNKPATWALAGLALEPGPNSIEVIATDESGAESREQIIVTRVVGATLEVSHTGNGSVSAGFEPSSQREVGKFYSITAKPAKGHLFAGWSGGIDASNAKLDFWMEEGLALNANFIPDPFPAVAGEYNGIIINGGGTELARNGFLRVTLTGKSTATGTLIIGGIPYGFKVTFSINGTGVVKITRKGAPTLTLEMRVDLDPDGSTVTGTLTDGDFVSDFIASRPLIDEAHPVPVGRYTLVFTDNPADPVPKAQGSAALRVQADGKVVIGGVFGDGELLTAASTISQAGDIAFYARTISKAANNTLYGALQLAAVNPEDPSGTLRWIRSAGGAFPGGIDRDIDATGSPFTPVVNDVRQLLPGLGATDGKAELTIVAGATPLLTHPLTFDVKKIIPGLPNTQKISVSSDVTVLSSGALRGSWTPVGARTAVPIKGVYFQRLDAAIGNDFPLGAAPGDAVVKPKP